LIFACDFARVARDSGLGVEGVRLQARATSLYIRIYPLAMALLKQVASWAIWLWVVFMLTANRMADWQPDPYIIGRFESAI
jgi:hypothetical protein